jgi:hypothetical protein
MQRDRLLHLQMRFLAFVMRTSDMRAASQQSGGAVA